MPRSPRSKGRSAASAALLASMVAGCQVPRNESPVAFGVPDGMVLGRDMVGTSALYRAEVVTFACNDQRAKAYVLTPIPSTGKPAQIEFATDRLTWPKPSGKGQITVMVENRRDLPHLKEAAKAMAASLTE